MALAFAGTAPFGADILRGLLDGAGEHAGREVALVISQPDRPAGRGQKVSSSAVTRLARERGLRLEQPERTHSDDMLARYAELGIDTIIVAAFGQMIREPLLSDYLLLNVHGSLLPAYRGAAPVERSIIDGCDETGVDIMQMEAGLDTGPVAFEGRVPITLEDDAGMIFTKIADVGAELLHRALDAAAAGTLTFTPQPKAGATYAHKIVAADRYLNFAVSSRALHDRVRGLSPHIGAFTWVGEERLGLWRTTIIDEAATASVVDETAENAADATGGDRKHSTIDNLARAVWQQPGVVSHTAKQLVIGTLDGAVEVLELQPAGKRRMNASDWLRGLREPLATNVTPPRPLPPTPPTEGS
ncbi:MAG: methionyl-tRNA formyltransferase [Thermoleophilia bacterium]|nr:methionyl-tRNA formyltransferase [Thermoleophilia bacterium]